MEDLEPGYMETFLSGNINGRDSMRNFLQISLTKIPSEMKYADGFCKSLYPYFIATLACRDLFFKKRNEDIFKSFSAFLEYRTDLRTKEFSLAFDTFIMEKFSNPAYQKEQNVCMDRFTKFCYAP